MRTFLSLPTVAYKLYQLCIFVFKLQLQPIKRKKNRQKLAAANQSEHRQLLFQTNALAGDVGDCPTLSAGVGNWRISV